MNKQTLQGARVCYHFIKHVSFGQQGNKLGRKSHKKTSIYVLSTIYNNGENNVEHVV